MTLGEFIARLEGSCKVNIYESNKYGSYGGYICTVMKVSPICRLFSEKKIIYFGATSNGEINVAIEAGDE